MRAHIRPADDSLEAAAASLHGFLGLPRFRAALFSGFAALAVTLVPLGLLAVVFHRVSQRTREIGIRLALGAQPAQVRRMIVLQSMTPTAIDRRALIVAAAVTQTMLPSYLPGVSPVDQLTLSAARVSRGGDAVRDSDACRARNSYRSCSGAADRVAEKSGR